MNDSTLGGLALNLAYGIPIQPRDDPYIKSVKESLREIEKAATPGTFLVDFIPWLKHLPAWVPGAGFHEVAKRSKIIGRELRDKPFAATLQHMVRA